MVCSFKGLKLLLVQFQFREWRCFSSPWYGSITGASHGGSLDCCALTRICKVQTKGCITLTTWCRLKLQHRQQGQWTVETKDLRIDNQHLFQEFSSNNKTWGRTETKASKVKNQSCRRFKQTSHVCSLTHWIPKNCGMILFDFGDPAWRLGHRELLENLRLMNSVYPTPINYHAELHRVIITTSHWPFTDSAPKPIDIPLFISWQWLVGS